MNSWRYVASRIRDTASGEEAWEIRELYLEEDGKFSYTANAVAPAGNSISELQRDLDNMLNEGDSRTSTSLAPPLGWLRCLRHDIVLQSTSP